MEDKRYKKVCEVCGNIYESSRAHSTVCGSRCRYVKHKQKHIPVELNKDQEYKLILHTHVNGFHLNLETAQIFIMDRFCSLGDRCSQPILEEGTKVYIKLFKHFEPKCTFIFVYELVDKTVLKPKKRVHISEETVYRIPRVKKV